jgi:pimeloyl-ACP methyl ester carboxylesterase
LTAALAHSSLAVNGIDLHVAEAGEGPPVVLLHGFPELWYSWRHQVGALAEAGYRALAPDMRGYGESSVPAATEAYALEEVCADFVAMLDAIGEPRAVFVGHDWGAIVAWQLALAHPDRVSAVVGASIPFTPPGPAPPVATMRAALGDDFYIVWFQEEGVADAALARDVRRTLTATKQWSPEWAAGEDRPPLPPWLGEADVQVYVDAFERTGFTGGLGYYRNLDRNWERSRALAGRRIEAPALFVTGSRDPVKQFMPAQLMDGWVTDLRGVVEVEGAGHWVQRERPDAFNAALLRFLGEL